MSDRISAKYLNEAVSSLPSGNDTIRTAWKSPSNIALVKYWGKYDVQKPRNPSLSFALSKSLTEMHLSAEPHDNKKYTLDYFFEGNKNPDFETRVRKYIDTILPYFPFLNGFRLEIRSSNTFPHSSGIASSASSMSALSLCLCSMEEKILGRRTDDEFYMKASFIARLGSGSASRSVFPGYCSWGLTDYEIPGSDEYASPLNLPAESIFMNLNDAVLIVSPGKKSVSSSKGHQLMDNHPYADLRYDQAGENHQRLSKALQNSDIDEFIRITESEALGLHGLMLSSDPGFVLLDPGSIEIIREVRDYREKHGSFVCFTIDAGPNIHLIYPDSEKDSIHSLINDRLKKYCHDGLWIDDRIGEGPEELSS